MYASPSLVSSPLSPLPPPPAADAATTTSAATSSLSQETTAVYEQDPPSLEGAITIKDDISPVCTMALGYFCEVHGPTVIFTTQAYPSSALISLGEVKDRLRNVRSDLCYDRHDDNGDTDDDDNSSDDDGTPSFMMSSEGGNSQRSSFSSSSSLSTQSSLSSSFMPSSLSYVPWNIAKSFKKQQFFNFDNASPSSVMSPVYSRSNAMYNSSVAKYISHTSQNQRRQQPQQPDQASSQETRSVPQRSAASTMRRSFQRSLTSSSSSSSKSLLSCKFCDSVAENDGYITTDEETRTIFVSKRVLNDTYTLTRQACTRALSCEWVPRDVYVLKSQKAVTKEPSERASGTTTTLSSSSSRASASSSSKLSAPSNPQTPTKPIYVLSKLQPLTQFIFGTYSNGYTLAINFRLDDSKARGNGRWYTVITTWQSSAYLAAVACNGLFESTVTPLIRELQKNASEVMKKEGPASTMGRNTGKPVGRSLSEITGIQPEKLYMKFHIAFCRAFLRFNNSMFIPCMDAAPQFYPTMKLVLGDIYNKPYSLNNFEGPEFGTETISQKTYNSSRSYNEEDFDALSSLNTPLVREFKLSTLLCNMNNTDKDILLYNCMVGNQIIVRGPHPGMCKVAVRAISRLLPDSLRGPICEYSSSYKPIFEAHFLGLPLNAEIPISDNVNRNFQEYVEDIFESIDSSASSSSYIDEVYSEGDLALKEDATVHAGRAVLTLSDDPGRGHVSGPFIPTTIVEELKLIFATKSNTAPEVSVSTLKSMKLTLLHERWTNLAKVAYSLKMKKFFNSEKTTKTALNALSLNRKDLYVLKFWMPCVKSKLFSK